MFNYADYKIWWKLKRLQAQLDYVVSRVNSIEGSVGTAGQQIYEGLTDPNVAGLVPTKPNIPALYNQYTSPGVPASTWWWSVSAQHWY